eukprot:8943509-Heterocapsa_arctica.AAC.1
MFEEVRTKVEGATPYDLSTLQVVGKYHWLLTTEQADKLKERTETLLGGGFGQATGGCDEKSEKDKKAEGKKGKNKQEATNL